MPHPPYLKVKIADDLTIVSPKKALEIAKSYMPEVYQYIEHDYDFLTDITFGDDHPFIANPTIPFAVYEENYAYYIIYMFYHWRDDNHLHDTECVLTRQPKSWRSNDRRIWVCVSHYDFLVKESSWGGRGYIIIKAGTHAVSYEGEGGCDNPYIYYPPTTFKFTDMLSEKFQDQWEDLKIKFNEHGVNMPDQFVDTDLENMLKIVCFEHDGHRVRSCRGDFLCNPPRLIETLKWAGRL